MILKLRTLNLRHGGGKRASALADYLVNIRSDILVLTEFRENAAGSLIKKRLEDVGFQFESSMPPTLTNGVAVAAKGTLPFRALAHPETCLPGQRQRWLECEFDNFSLVATYFPGMKPKLEYWKWFMPQSDARVAKPCILVGDFNTGKHLIDEAGSTFFGPEYMTAMESAGWIDAWRSLHPTGREYTWQSNKGGEFRLDYVWLSPLMAHWLSRADHDIEPRHNRITDHSALAVELLVPDKAA